MADLTVPDSIKMLRETFCEAQAVLSSTCITPFGPVRKRTEEHIARLQRLIDDCDRQRPLGPDGKHGDRHTATCGCEGVLVDNPHEGQTCGFHWETSVYDTPVRHQCADSRHPRLTDEHHCRCGETRPGVVVLSAQIGREA